MMLAAVDGAVILTQGLDLIGFGGAVKGVFSKEDIIARTIDAERDRVYMNEPKVSARAIFRSITYARRFKICSL